MRGAFFGQATRKGNKPVAGGPLPSHRRAYRQKAGQVGSKAETLRVGQAAALTPVVPFEPAPAASLPVCPARPWFLPLDGQSFLL